MDKVRNGEDLRQRLVMATGEDVVAWGWGTLGAGNVFTGVTPSAVVLEFVTMGMKTRELRRIPFEELEFIYAAKGDASSPGVGVARSYPGKGRFRLRRSSSAQQGEHTGHRPPSAFQRERRHRSGSSAGRRSQPPRRCRNGTGSPFRSRRRTPDKTTLRFRPPHPPARCKASPILPS